MRELEELGSGRKSKEGTFISTFDLSANHSRTAAEPKPCRASSSEKLGGGFRYSSGNRSTTEPCRLTMQTMPLMSRMAYPGSTAYFWSQKTITPDCVIRKDSPAEM